jgi:peptidoglycan/xylan/chitin deacetylase (PgdA/CDA1 family)
MVRARDNATRRAIVTVFAIFGLLSAGLVMVGALTQPSARPDRDVIRRLPRGCHEVALTFDLCPVREGSGFDAALVDELAAEKIPATFFLSGRWITHHDSAVRRLRAVPFFEIETHGQAHAHLQNLQPDAQRHEIDGPVELLRKRYHIHATFFRPPYGEYDGTTVDVARELGQHVVLWSAASGDPDRHLSEAAIVAALSPRLHDGSVLVFHANGRGWHTREVVRDLAAELERRPLRPATISEMVNGCDGGR